MIDGERCKTCKFWKLTPIGVAMFFDISDKLVVLFFTPCSFLCSIFIKIGSSNHGGVGICLFVRMKLRLRNEVKAKENWVPLFLIQWSWNAYHVFWHLQSWIRTYIIQGWTHGPTSILLRLLANTVLHPFTWQRQQCPSVHIFICCCHIILCYLSRKKCPILFSRNMFSDENKVVLI